MGVSMKLFELLKGVKCRIFGSSLIEVDGLFHFDKDVKGKGLFFCLNGTNTQGEEYVLSAINKVSSLELSFSQAFIP